MSEKKVAEVCAKVLALREIKTMITQRAQNVALQTLNDSELAEAALRLSKIAE